MISRGQLDPRVATDLPKVVELQPGAGLGLDGAGQQHTETAVSTPPAPALPDPLHQAGEEGAEPCPRSDLQLHIADLEEQPRFLQTAEC